MEHIKLIDSNQNVIFSDLTHECNECFKNCSVESEIIDKCKHDSKKCRIGVKESINGTVFFCSRNKDELKSSKYFKKQIEIYGNVINGVDHISNTIKKQINTNTGILLHNLVSLNAHNIQEVHAVMPQEGFAKNARERISMAKNMIEANSIEFAKSMYRISKNNTAMKIEFSVFNRLIDDSQPLSFRRHDIQRVFMSLLHNFFQDFNTKKVYVNVDNGSFDIYVDYEAMHVVFHHILENAAKYCLRGKDIDISISPVDRSISIEMHSLEITDKDMNYIYEEGYSGDYAQLAGKNGKGIGMSRVKKLLDMNNATIEIRRNIDPASQVIKKGVSYMKNAVIIFFSSE